MSFTLSWPTTSPTETVILRDPQLGNIQRIQGTGLVHRNRNGEVQAAQIATHNVIYSEIFKFTLQSASIVSDLEAFLLTTAGCEIKIIDHNGDEKNGYILNNIREIITLRDDCLYDIQLEFVETV